MYVHKLHVGLGKCFQIGVVTMLVGCVTPPVTYEASTNLVPQDSRGAVVVYWHQTSKLSSIFRNAFGLDKMEVMVDNKMVGELKPNTHAILGIKQGQRKLMFHIKKSTHDSGEVEKVDIKIGNEVVYDIATDRVASASTHYESGYWDESCNCEIGGGEEPDYYYFQYDLRKLSSITSEGEKSERSFVYIEP